MKLALIGCGRIAAVHIESVVKYISDSAQLIEIVALIDINLFNAERFKRTFNLSCKIFSQLEEAVQDIDLDSAIISVLHYLPENLVLRAPNQKIEYSS